MIDRPPLVDAWLPSLFVASASATLVLTIAVLRGWTRAIDMRLFARLSRRGNELAGPMATGLRDLSALGGDMLRLLFLLACLVGLIAAGRVETGLALLAICLPARLIAFLVKAVLRRPRPDADAPALATFTTSFPSGHSFMAVVVYLSAALLIPRDPAMVGAAACYAMLLGLAVGATRFAFGVHWPSDILVGWLAGLAWVSGALLVVS
jgi:undecaprenyl-diphosphatase